ncbi:MAG: hypothetical protein U0V70_08855 [Terriglobia bacterium]
MYSVLELIFKTLPPEFRRTADNGLSCRIGAIFNYEQIRQSAEAFSQWLDTWSPLTPYLEPSFRLYTVEEHVSQWVGKLAITLPTTPGKS